MSFGKTGFLKSVLFVMVCQVLTLSSNTTTQSNASDVLIASITDDQTSTIETESDAAAYIDALANTYFGALDGSDTSATGQIVIRNLTVAINLTPVDSNGGALTTAGQANFDSLADADQKNLVKNLKLILYGFNSKLWDCDKNAPTAKNTLSSLINNLITIFSSTQEFSDTFAGQKKRLDTSLNVYSATVDATTKLVNTVQLDKLVAANNILAASGSATSVLGNSKDGSTGFLDLLISQRMQEDISGLVGVDGNPISDTALILEDPAQSWQQGSDPSLQDLISYAGTKLKPYWLAKGQTIDALNAICLALQNKLRAPITVDERVAALQARVDDRSLDISSTISKTNGQIADSDVQKDTNFIKMNGIINRLLSAFSTSTTPVPLATRQKAYTAVDNYRINNQIPAASLNTAMTPLSRSAFSDEIISEGTMCCLQMSGLTNGQAVYLAVVEDDSSPSAVKYNITTSSTGIMGASRFLVCIYNQDNIVLEWLKDDSVSGNLAAMQARKQSVSLTDPYYYYLMVDTTGMLVIHRQAANANSNATTSNDSGNFIAQQPANRATFFGAIPTSGSTVTNPNNAYYFQAYGSQSKLSLKHVGTGGFVACCMDNTFKTISPGDGKPFSLTMNADGTINQESNTTFNAIAVVQTAIVLANGRRGANCNFFAIHNTIDPTISDISILTNDATITGTDLTQSLNLTIKPVLSNNTRSASITVPAELANFTKAAQQAVVEQAGRSLLLDEINYFLDAVRNCKATYTELTSTSTNVTTFNNILSSFATAFATDLSSNTLMSTSFNRAQAIWNYIQATAYHDVVVDSSVPTQGQTVAFKFPGNAKLGTPDSYLVAMPVTDVSGNVTYDLFVTPTTNLSINPSNPATHFDVICSDGVFGFSSKLAQGAYLTVKDSSTYDQSGRKQVSELTFAPLVSTDKNGKPEVFEAADNQSKQFLLTLATAGTPGIFYIQAQDKNNPFYLGKWIDKTNQVPYDGVVLHDVPITTATVGAGFTSTTQALTTSNIMNLAVVSISAFLQALGSVSVNTDDVARINTYTSLLDSVQTLDDLTAWESEVKNFLMNKKDSFDDWNKFLTDPNKIGAFNTLFNKLVSVVGVWKATSKTLAKALLDDLQATYTSDFSLPLSAYSNPNVYLALKWFDANSVVHYLKALANDSSHAGSATNPTPYSIVPQADTLGDPDVKIRLFVNQSDNSVKIRFENVGGFLKVDSNGGAVSIDLGPMPTDLTATVTEGTSFFLEGQINALSIKLDSTVTPTQYLGIKGMSQPIICYPGLTSDIKTTPLAGQQLFAIEQISARELELINARSLCDLTATKWSNYASAAGGWNVLADTDLTMALRQRIGSYATIVAEIFSDPSATASDKSLFVSEVQNFVTQLTTLLQGHAWTDMTSDNDLSTNFENNVLAPILKFTDSNSKPQFQIQHDMILNMWTEGYTAPGEFSNKDIVALSFQTDKIPVGSCLTPTATMYLRTTTQTYQGANYKMLSAADTFLTNDAQYVVYTYKNQLVLSPVAYPSNYVSVKLASSSDTQFLPLTRATVLSVSQQAGTSFNFLDPVGNGCIFQYDIIKDPQSGKDSIDANGNLIHNLVSNILDTTGKINGILVVDRADSFFAKLDLNATPTLDIKGTSTTDTVSVLRIIKLDAFHNRLAQAYSASTVKQSLEIFSEILSQDYINNSDQASLFTVAIVTAFYGFRADAIGWNKFISDTDTSQSVSDFLALVSNKATIIDFGITPGSVLNSTQIGTAIQGDATINVVDYSGIYVAVGWNDPNSQSSTEYFVTRRTINNVDASGTDQQASISQLLMAVPSGNPSYSGFTLAFDARTTSTDVSLYFNIGSPTSDGNSDSYYIGLTTKPYVNNLSSASNPLLFEASLIGSDRIYFRNKNSVNPNNPEYLTLFVEPDGTKNIALAKGTLVGDGSTPTAFQIFNFYKIGTMTDFARQVSVAKCVIDPLDNGDGSKNAAQRINAYNGLITQLLKNPVSDNLKTLITEIGNFVTDYTTDQYLYNAISNNKNNNTALLSLFAQLNKAAGKDQPPLALIEAVVDNWTEGYTGTVDSAAPLDGDKVIASIVLTDMTTTTSNLLSLETVPFQDQNTPMYQFQLSTNDQTDHNCQLKVHVHKNKLGFESVSKSGYYLAVQEALTNVTDAKGTNTTTITLPDDISSPVNRLTFMILGENASSEPIVFGNKGSEKFEFFVTSTGASGSPFYLQSVLDKTITTQSNSTSSMGSMVIDSTDYSFARIRRLQASTATLPNAIVAFLPVTKLHDQLFVIKSKSSDQEILETYYETLTGNYVTNVTEATLFGQCLQNYYLSKMVDAPTWKAFSSDNSLAKETTLILSYFKQNPSLFQSINANITNLISRGFAQALNDGDYIYLTWQATGASPWILEVLPAVYSGKAQAAEIFSSVQNSQPSAMAVLRIKSVIFNGTSYIQLITEESDGDYALTINDTIGTKLARVTATFVNITTPPTGDALKRTLFTYQGSSDKMAFQNLYTGGYLSIATAPNAGNRDVATVTDTTLVKITGNMVAKTRNPGQQELFTATILNNANRALIAMASPAVGTVGDCLSQFLNYPAFYQQQTNTLLLNASDTDKGAFVNAIHNFVTVVVGDQNISNSLVPGVDDGSFASLISLAQSLNLNIAQQAQLTADTAMWSRGYSSLVSELGLPDNGVNFVLAVSAAKALTATAATTPDASSSSSLNNCYSVEPLIIYPIKSQFDGVYRLGTLDFNTILRPFVNGGFSDDELFEKYILNNDPFVSKALLTSLISREVFGISTNLVSGDLLTTDTGVTFPTSTGVTSPGGKLDLEKWQQAIAYFGSGDFSQDGANPVQFAVTQDALTGDFIIASDAIQDPTSKTAAVLSVDASDGFLRVFKRSTDGKTASLITAANATSFEKFVIAKASDFYQCITKARAAWNVSGKENDIISNYQQAMFAVKSQQDLDWMAEELIRFVVSKKVDQNTWTTFLANTDFVNNFEQLINGNSGFVSTFVKFDSNNTIQSVVSNLLVKQLHYNLLQTEAQCLSGVLVPHFLANIVLESAVPEFAQSFTNLQTRLNNLNSSGITAFMTDIQTLLARKVEVVLESGITGTSTCWNTDTDATNMISEVADWLELVCTQNAVITSSSNKQKCLDMATGLRATYNYTSIDPNGVPIAVTTIYTYADLLADVNNMAQNIPGFSADRADLFIKQAAKLVHPLSLTMALSEAISMSDAKQAIRMVLSNQMAVMSKNALDSSATKFSPCWLGNITGTGLNGAVTYGDYLNTILSKFAYPLSAIKGQAFVNLVSNTLAIIAGMNTSDPSKVEDSMNQLYDIISAWDGSIGSKLVTGDVQNMVTANTNVTASVLKSLQRQLAISFISYIKGAVSFMTSHSVNKTIISQYNTVITAVANSLGVDATKAPATMPAAATATSSSAITQFISQGSTAATTTTSSSATTTTPATSGQLVLSLKKPATTTASTTAVTQPVITPAKKLSSLAFKSSATAVSE